MRCKPLTSTKAFLTDTNGIKRLASSYEWNGDVYKVCDSARNILSIIGLFKGDASRDDVSQELLYRLFFDPVEAYLTAGEDLSQLVYDIMWDICGLDVTPDGEHTEGESDPWFDWDEDADRIRVSLRAAYGIDWDEKADEITFSDACSLIFQLPEYGVNTPFERAAHYRLGKPPSAKAVGSDGVDAWHEARDFYELKGSDGSLTDQNDAMASLFKEVG